MLAVLAMGATVETTQYPGEPSTIVERSGDGLVPSFRYRGTQRFDTARLIGEDSFDSPDQVLIARGDLYPDSLSGSFVAGNLDAPLLLTESRRLTPDTRNSLNRLNPDEVLVLGGTSAIHAATVDAIEAEGFAVERIAGPDRFDTAREAATYTGTSVGTRDDEGGEFDGRAAIVARADQFPDALVAGSVSYASRYPLLLTTGATLHEDAEAALESLSIDTVIVPGGTSGVSANVEQEIESMGITVDRVTGTDRVETSVNFAYFLRDELGFDIEHINMARGDAFPDALAIGPHAGEEANPIVLTADNNTLGGAGSVSELLELVCGVGNMHVAGGFNAISQSLEQDMRQRAVDTGAICDVSFDEGGGPDDVVVNELGAETRTVQGTVTDNAGEPSNDQATVRWQVFRGDFQQQTGDIELLEEGTTTTDSSSRFSFDYAAPDERAWDYVVACTVETSNDDVGEDPGTCLDDPDSTTLSVDDRDPQNIGDNLAWNFHIKQWGQEETEPQEEPGDPDDVQFENDLAINPVGTEHTATATVTDADGDPVSGVDVRFEVFRNDDPVIDPEPQFSYLADLTVTDATTNGDGQATFTYDGPDDPADDRIVACLPDDGATGDPICGEVVDASGDPDDDDASQTVEATDAFLSDITRKLWGFPADAMTAEATGIQGTLLGQQLLDQPTSRIELPGPNGEIEDEETGGLNIGVLDDVVELGLTETRAAGNLGIGIARAEASTADVEVLGLTGGPSLGGLLEGLPLDLGTLDGSGLLDGVLNGGDGGLLDGIGGILSEPGSASTQQILDGDGNVLGAELIEVASTSTCRGPYANLGDASDSRFVGLEVLGQDIPVDPAPNTSIGLEGLVEVTINEVVPTGDPSTGAFGYEVRGLRVQLLDTLLSGGVDIIIDEAITTVDCAAESFDTPDYFNNASTAQAAAADSDDELDAQAIDPRPFLRKLEAMTERQVFTEEQWAQIDRNYEAWVQGQQQ